MPTHEWGTPHHLTVAKFMHTHSRVFINCEALNPDGQQEGSQKPTGAHHSYTKPQLQRC